MQQEGSEKLVEIFTDGACKGNPGVGGWGVCLKFDGETREYFGGESMTTNNRMELLAAIRALQELESLPDSATSLRVQLHTDSQYVQKGISEWIHSWKKRGWLTADKKPVKNEALWRELDQLSGRYQVEWFWVRGHNGHDGNERADMLANRGVVSALSGQTD
ncbi:MAG: ribonuclease HI [Nitrosomonas sp.]|uniref:ribonuclease HI n=1 Tax=Nitrosomonas sp. TaxID=42353 RepID=UPI002562BE29|nr:ribonuclease HI [Nitrosomonas sp.]MBE7527265.1 ribonuclease HI [Burkholderiales bacterium]MCC6160907.1 ribonuclease HI [Nitrosomonas sp.]MDL1866488.1 ribonuclease HI [Betaproteobacteria bacterium PRO4]